MLRVRENVNIMDATYLSPQAAKHPFRFTVSLTHPKLKRGARDLIDVKDFELFAGP